MLSDLRPRYEPHTDLPCPSLGVRHFLRADELLGSPGSEDHLGSSSPDDGVPSSYNSLNLVRLGAYGGLTNDRQDSVGRKGRLF